MKSLGICEGVKDCEKKENKVLIIYKWQESRELMRVVKNARCIYSDKKNHSICQVVKG